VAIESDPDKKMDIQEYRTSEDIQAEILLKLLDEKASLTGELLEQIKSIHEALVNQNKETE